MMTQQPFFTTLKGRGLLKISGIERKTFLQGLITNDINMLDTQPCIYACLLSPQGKFLYDFFIHEENDILVLDCEGGERLSSLAKMLNMYKLRSAVEIDSFDDASVYAIFGQETGYKDPRHIDMGYRAYSKPIDLEEREWEEWDYKRISLTIPDGSRDLQPGKSTMDEARIDQLGGISYHKGCYIGQELTARMHYRGLGKKHLYTVTAKALSLEAFPENGSALYQDDRLIGEMRSSCRDLGIALIKDELAETLL